jgi:hypothetical protein
MADNDNTQMQVVSLAIRPFRPDTVDTVRSELTPMIEKALREHGREDLLIKGQIKIEIEKSLPLDQTMVYVIITIVTGVITDITAETFKEIVIPKLKKRFDVEEKNRVQDKNKD